MLRTPLCCQEQQRYWTLLANGLVTVAETRQLRLTGLSTSGMEPMTQMERVEARVRQRVRLFPSCWLRLLPACLTCASSADRYDGDYAFPADEEPEWPIAREYHAVQRDAARGRGGGKRVSKASPP